MGTIAIAVSAGAAGALGWCCRASARMASLVRGAGGGRPLRTGWRRRACWALAAAFATGAVVASLPESGANAFPSLIAAALALWAGALAILALIDHESLVVPTKLVRPAIVVAGSLLASGALSTGDWRYLWQGAACAGMAAGSFGAWAAVNPRGLGFGDARMASLVALGSGALSPPGSLVALACSALAAGLAGRRPARHVPGAERRAVALGPFLAVGGLVVVIAHAS